MGYDAITSRTDVASLVPEQVSNMLLENLSAESAALRLFPSIKMATNVTRMPVLAALPTAYWVTGDTGLKQTTDMAWDNKFINVEELAAICPIPENVLDDTSFDVWGSIRPHLEQAIARAIDQAIFFGVNKPSSWPAAIGPDAIAKSHTVNRTASTSAAGGLASDFSNLFATVEADGYDVDFIVANRVYKGYLRNNRNPEGIVFQELSPTSVYGVEVGYPMRGLWPAQTTGNIEAIVGSRGEGIIGMRTDFQYKMLDQAVIQDQTGRIVYNLPQQDMVALRVTFRLGWQIANTINYDNQVEATRYPFAVMLTP